MAILILQTMRSEFGSRKHKSEKWQWRHDVSPNSFEIVLFLLSGLVFGPSFLSISSLVLELWQFFPYKGLTRNPEIGNSPVSVLLNIWRLGKIRDTKFGKNISNKIVMNAAKCQGYKFYRFWVIKEKPTGS